MISPAFRSSSGIFLDRRLVLALTLYITALFASNTVGIKIMPFLFGTHLSTAIFAFPLVFMTTDVVGEVYGKAHARLFVLAGFVSLVIFLIFNLLSNVMPSSAEFLMPESYAEIFGLSFRFTVASLVAFIAGEYQDVLSFFFLRARTGGRFFWLRSNLSNCWGQAVDTILWFSIAFVGVYPLRTIILMMIPWWAFKVAAGVVYSPLSYIGIWFLRQGKNEAISA